MLQNICKQFQWVPQPIGGSMQHERDIGRASEDVLESVVP
jgi:hypothetical protein